MSIIGFVITERETLTSDCVSVRYVASKQNKTRTTKPPKNKKMKTTNKPGMVWNTSSHFVGCRGISEFEACLGWQSKVQDNQIYIVRRKTPFSKKKNRDKNK